jgi:hypothetical protein
MPRCRYSRRNPTQRHEPFPLNDIQQAYWVGRSGAVELGNVTTHAYMEIDGSGVNLQRMSAALQKLILRQDMLRAIILPSGDQRILSDVPPYQMPVVDLSMKTDGDAAVVLEAIREEMSHQVLAFDHWPLFDIRATLLANDRMRTHISIDLIIMDLGSLHVFMKEWEDLYLHPDGPLPPLEISFRDFLLTEREIERTEAVQAFRAVLARPTGNASAAPAATARSRMPLRSRTSDSRDGISCWKKRRGDR